MSDGLVEGPDGALRCWWGASTPEYAAYHDEEWGKPVRDDRGMYERLCLEAFQSGLSWLTILRKREGFRAAFADFEPQRVAAFGDEDVARLMADAAIVRNRLKIEAAIANAKTVLALRKSHGSFAGWLDAHLAVDEDVKRARTKEEWVALFKKTFRFTGGEIVGEFLLSTGYLPGAHRESCPVYSRVLTARPPYLRLQVRREK